MLRGLDPHEFAMKSGSATFGLGLMGSNQLANSAWKIDMTWRDSRTIQAPHHHLALELVEMRELAWWNGQRTWSIWSWLPQETTIQKCQRALLNINYIPGCEEVGPDLQQIHAIISSGDYVFILMTKFKII